MLQIFKTTLQTKRDRERQSEIQERHRGKEDDGDRNSCAIVINMYNEFNFVNKQMRKGFLSCFENVKKSEKQKIK